MSLSRRDFVKSASAAAALTALGSRADALDSTSVFARTHAAGAADYHDLAMRALDAAKGAGAQYADVRIAQYRSQSVQTRERRVQGLSDTETAGIGVRALVNGAWGFAATANLTPDSVAAIARSAVAQARANRAALAKPIVLAPYGAVQKGEWRSPIKVDPFTVPVADKVALLLAVNAAALKVKGTRFVQSSMNFLREEKTFANSEGSYTVQTLYRSSPNVNITAVSADNSDFQTRAANEIAPRGMGYEHVTEADLADERDALGGRSGAKAVRQAGGRRTVRSRAASVASLAHDPRIRRPPHRARSRAWLRGQLRRHELRVAAGKSARPAASYGSNLMNIRGDRTQVGSLSACGWDDEGVVPDTYDIIKDGVFVDYQTTREQAPYLEWYYKKIGKPVRSHGNSYAQFWSDVQFQRMPNVSLLPGEKDTVWEDLIAATDAGIAIIGDGSFSIDQQRYNAQFGGQVFYEIKGGKIVGMLKDVAYQMRTPDFWKSMDMIGGPRSYHLGGANGDAKGQPAQSNAVSHGCVPARFHQINVINTGRTA